MLARLWLSGRGFQSKLFKPLFFYRSMSTPSSGSVDISELRKQYSALAKHYSLPGFDALNAEFEIEKVQHDSPTLLRAVRKAMIEKVFNVLNFLEMLLNPMNAPRIYHASVKSMSAEEHRLIEQAYGALGDAALRALVREVDYSEKEEAAMIKEIVRAWEKARRPLRAIMQHLVTPPANAAKKEKSYFG